MSQRMEELMVTKVEHVSDEMPMDMDWAEGLRMKIGVDELNDTDSQNVKDEPVSEDYEEASTSQIAKKCKDEPDSATISDSFQISAVFHVGGSDDSNDSTVNPVSISQLSSSALISGTTHGVFCKECGKILSKGQTAFQPKGSSKMYCSVECLASVNTQNKTCFHCSRELSGTESMVSAQLDPADTMKDFCSQKCLSAMSFSCQVCQKTSLVYTHTINFSGVVHKLCSYDCFNQFCSTNNICENCGVSCNNLGSTRFTLQIENRIMTFCKHNCKESFKKKFSNPVSCKMCQNKCALSDMMECLNTDGTQELYCSSSCITAKNNQGVGLSDAAVECFNCKKNVPLKYHVALPHGTLRKFCSYSCVDAYQEVYSKGNSSSQPVTTKSKSSLKRPAESSSSGKTGQTVTKIPCSQCHTSFFHKPELLEFKMEPKRRKVDEENRTFNPAWEYEFAFVDVHGKPICLICRKMMSVFKRSNLQRHHELLHADFKDAFPLDGQLRKHKIQTLRDSFQPQQTPVCIPVKRSDCVTEASFKIAWNIAKAKKPATDGEFLKKTFIDCAESLFSGFQNKDEIIEQISKLQLSQSTIRSRVEDMTESIFSQLLNDIESAECFSLALNESTYTAGTTHVLVWVRFLRGDRFAEEMLTLLTLKSQTQGEEMYQALKEFFHGPGKNINLKNLVSVTTNGAPSMMDKDKGLISLLRNDPEMSLFFSYHCILSLEQLCCELRGGVLKETMESVVKIVKFVCTHALKQEELRPLFEECESSNGKSAIHPGDRWLNRGKILGHFIKLLPAVHTVLTEKAQNQLLSLLNDDSLIESAGFLTDLLCHLNALYHKLQDGHKTLPMVFNDLAAFETKLDLFTRQVRDNDLTHFPVLQSVMQSMPPDAYLSYLMELQEQFSQRFSDIKVMEPVLGFTENPFACDVLSTSVAVRDHLSGVNKAMFEEQLIELQHNTFLKERHKEMSVDVFWMSVVPTDTYPALIQCAQKILTCFGSTHVCESSISAMNVIKSKHRTRLNDKHFLNYLRAAISDQKPNLKVLVKNMHTQMSH